MAFCKNCGNKLDDDAIFCPQCGTKAASASESTNASSEQTTQNTQNAQSNDFSDKFDKIMDTPDTTANFDTKDIEENKILALVSYLSLLFLIPYFVAPKSRFTRFHVNQGAILFIISFIPTMVFSLLSQIPFVGALFAICNWVVNIVALVFAILGIINACSGKAKELPIIGKYTIIKY